MMTHNNWSNSGVGSYRRVPVTEVATVEASEAKFLRLGSDLVRSVKILIIFVVDLFHKPREAECSRVAYVRETVSG